MTALTVTRLLSGLTGAALDATTSELVRFGQVVDADGNSVTVVEVRDASPSSGWCV